jgi:hypothetical protein
MGLFRFFTRRMRWLRLKHLIKCRFTPKDLTKDGKKYIQIPYGMGVGLPARSVNSKVID